MIVTQTPLRLSFFGGGTDFPDYYRVGGGAVLTTAIDKYVYVIIKERFDDDIYINYSIKEIVQSVDAIRHDLVREAMRIAGASTRSSVLRLRSRLRSRCWTQKLPKPRSSTFLFPVRRLRDAPEHGVNDDLDAPLRQSA